MNSISAQALLLCLLLGAALGLLFTVIEALRILFSLGRISTAVLDILFCVVTSASSFVLALAAAKGSLRFFQAACEIIGFLAVDLSLTHSMRCVLPRFVRRGRRVSDRLWKRMEAVGKNILRKKRASKTEGEKKRGFFGKSPKKNEKKT